LGARSTGWQILLLIERITWLESIVFAQCFYLQHEARNFRIISVLNPNHSIMTAPQIVAKARKLPQVSAAALRLAELLDDAGNGFEEAAALIKSDSLLTAKLLRACNSSAFGFSERIASVDQALMMLGFQEVRRLVLSLGFAASMNGTLPGYSMEPNELWQHALVTGSAAEHLVNRGELDCDAAVAFTAGLLHDIGKVVIAQVISLEAQTVIGRHMNGEGLGSVEAEREVLGTDHAEVGACLLHIWRLPEPIVEAVANHHRPVFKPSPQLSAVAHAANRIAHLAMDASPEDRYFLNDDPSLLAVGLSGEAGEKAVADARGSLERARELALV
jgi:putative nucleotidyltransferase with HDIG domain